MILAIAMENGVIATHYFHSERFDLYEIKDFSANYVESVPYLVKDHLKSF